MPTDGHLIVQGGPHVQVVKTVHYRIKPFDHLTTVSGAGSSHIGGTCETRSAACGCVRCFFSGALLFSPYLLIENMK